MVKENNTVMKKFDITADQYMMLFGYRNQYGIFHPDDNIRDYSDSRQYDLVYVSEHSSDAPSDVLKDISLMIRAGKLDLKVNDVISVKVNGLTSSYRYCGMMRLQWDEDFIMVPDFLKREKEFYVGRIHEMNMVLSVLDATMIPMNELNIENDNVYCIEKETYSSSNGAGRVVSNYSLLMLKNGLISNMNPNGRPFVMIANALYYFMRKKRKEKGTLLLLDKHEFELLRDFHDLNNVKLVVV